MVRNKQAVELEMGVCYGDSPKLDNLGVCHAAPVLAAVAGFIITDAETGT